MDAISYRTAVAAQLNLPNYLTAARAVMFVPVVVFLFLGGNWHWGAVVMVLVAGASDGLDGYLARQWNMVTPLGRVGDPLSDKCFINISFIPVLMIHQSTMLVWLWGVVMAYDVYSTGRRRHEIARAFLNLPQDRPDVPASSLSKAKTAVLFLLLAYGCMPSEYVGADQLFALTMAAATLVFAAWLEKFVKVG